MSKTLPFRVYCGGEQLAAFSSQNAADEFACLQSYDKQSTFKVIDLKGALRNERVFTNGALQV